MRLAVPSVLAFVAAFAATAVAKDAPAKTIDIIKAGDEIKDVLHGNYDHKEEKKVRWRLGGSIGDDGGTWS